MADMSQGRGPDFIEGVKKKFLAKTATTPALASGLSVNSLSMISDRFTKISHGESIRRLSFWIAFVLCAWLLADLLALLAEKYIPSAPVSVLSSRIRNVRIGSGPMDYDIVPNRNLFSSKVPSKNSDEIDLSAEPVPTTLPINLIGTVIFKNPSRSLAALQDKNDSKVYPVRAGDEIMDGQVQIFSVESRRVVFINTQSRRKEFTELPEDPTLKISMGSSHASKASTSEVPEIQKTVQGAEIDAAIANLGSLVTQARAVPVSRGGQMIGFQLVEIQAGSIFEKLIKKNDIVKGANGEKITDVAKAMEFVTNLKNLPSIDLMIERDGKDMQVHYDIRR